MSAILLRTGPGRALALALTVTLAAHWPTLAAGVILAGLGTGAIAAARRWAGTSPLAFGAVAVMLTLALIALADGETTLIYQQPTYPGNVGAA